LLYFIFQYGAKYLHWLTC